MEQFAATINDMTERLGKKHVELPTLKERDVPSWLEWKRLTLGIIKQNGWANPRAKTEIMRHLQGNAYAAVAGNEPTDKDAEGRERSYIDLINHFHALFVPASATYRARQLFNKAEQTEGETVEMWHTRLRLAHLQAYPDQTSTEQEKDPMLTEIFVGNLHHPEVRRFALNNTYATYHDALQGALKGLASHQQMVSKGEDPSLSAMSMVKGQAYNNAPVSGCFQCGGPHFVKFCPTAASGSAAGPSRQNHFSNRGAFHPYQRAGQRGGNNFRGRGFQRNRGYNGNGSSGNRGNRGRPGQGQQRSHQYNAAYMTGSEDSPTFESAYPSQVYQPSKN